MGGEKDRRALCLLLSDNRFEHVLIDGVQSAKGLVEDQQVWLVEHGRDELNLLLHALGKVLDLL